ncbi:MAG: aminotransferase class III-fold pyridoxal phosphate-dependent enzyme [Rhizobiales bacterium]|nr:aminotransferase class III-fold pyridoxal phosphate-dependent enzyme [Hyphomicrobiales bacterium]
MIDAATTLALTRAHESASANTFRLVSDPPVFVRGEGPFLFTDDGERYLDLVCGSATTNLGHGHPAHVSAIGEVLSTGILHTGTRLPSPWRAELYRSLVDILPAGIDTVQFVNSGAEAIEAAIKVAQYATGRRRLVAFEGGYHGRTLGALSITSGERIRAPFSTLEHLVDILPYADGSPARSASACLAEAERLLERRADGGDPPAIMVVEAVQGVAGVIEPPAPFLEGLAELCRRHDVVLALDEIWCGFARAGRWFAFERAGIAPDLVVMGKALSGGLPLAAVAGPARLLKAWPPGMHTSTFQGNPLACAMAVAGIETIAGERLAAHAEEVIAPMLRTRLAPLAGSAGVGAVRVVGAMAAVGIEATGAGSGSERNAAMQTALLRRRILAYGGGRGGDCLMLLPPLNLEAGILAEALAAVTEVIGACP